MSVLHLLNASGHGGPRITALVAVLVAVACGDRAPQPATRNPQPATRIVDDYGHAVTIAAPPTRIVSLNPATTELLFAIGAGSRVVGRTQYDNWPDSAKLVPSVGQGIRPNLEAVLARRPDFVILYASDADRGTVDRLAAAGVTAIALRDDHIRDLERVTMMLGQIVGDTTRARDVVDSVTATLNRVRRATAPLPRPTVFVHAWDKPLMTLGGGSFISELLSIAGARNIYDSLAAPSQSVAIEDVVRRNPDYILVSPGEEKNVLAAPRGQSLGAVRAGRVVAYDTNLVARPAVKLGEAAVSLAKIFHPELHLGR